MNCTLCNGDTGNFLHWEWEEREFVRFENWRAILLLPEFWLDFVVEQGQYFLFNDAINPRYKEFLDLKIIWIRNDFSINSKGLILLACGIGPVAAVELVKLGFSVNLSIIF